jgi:hypothetical protein
MRNHHQQPGQRMGFNNIMTKQVEKFRDKITSFFLLTPLLFLAAGCNRDQVQVYRVASDQDQSAQPAISPTNLSSAALPPGHPDISTLNNSSGQMPAGIAASDAQNAPPLSWTTPGGWTEVPAGAMRVASFKVADPGGKTADVSVVPLPGLAGGDIANVNRWRGQVGLLPALVDALQNSSQNVEAGSQPAQLYDIGGASSRILAVIQHRDGTTWFFKMTGDPDLVEQQKPAFITFLQSLNFSSPQVQAALPPGHPAIAPDASSGSISHEGQPGWQVPPDWQETSGGQFLIAKFLLKGAGDGRAAVNVSRSNGDGGGLAANVNRWRGQIGLAPVGEVSASHVTISGVDAALVDLNGTNAQTALPVRLIGVIVGQDDHTWFYKLMGDPTVVGNQKDAFVKFVQGVVY